MNDEILDIVLGLFGVDVWVSKNISFYIQNININVIVVGNEVLISNLSFVVMFVFVMYNFYDVFMK